MRLKTHSLFRDIWTSIVVLALLLGGAWVLAYGALIAWFIWTGQL